MAESFERRRPPASSPGVRKRMQSTRRHGTPKELEIRARLENLGYSFLVDHPPMSGMRRRGDLIFQDLKVVVFVDGCFWHGCPQHGTWPKTNAEWWREKIERNRRRDVDTDRLLESNGWAVVRIWEHEPLDAAIAAILKTLRLVKPRGAG